MQNDTLIIWQNIAKALKKIYKEEGILKHFKNDEKYLKEAFLFTENLWWENFNKIPKLNLIMISESPFFGDSKTYIYNKNTAPSVFFYFKDLEVFKENLEKPKDKIKQKELMYEIFKENGFITLDIFAFALNPNHTKIHYRNISKKLYTKLLEITTKEYLEIKLKKCLEKVDENSYFIYRYKRLFDKTGNHFEKVLKQIDNKSEYKIDTINGKGMHLDKPRLKGLINKAKL